MKRPFRKLNNEVSDDADEALADLRKWTEERLGPLLHRDPLGQLRDLFDIAVVGEETDEYANAAWDACMVATMRMMRIVDRAVEMGSFIEAGSLSETQAAGFMAMAGIFNSLGEITGEPLDELFGDILEDLGLPRDAVDGAFDVKAFARENDTEAESFSDLSPKLQTLARRGFRDHVEELMENGKPDDDTYNPGGYL